MPDRRPPIERTHHGDTIADEFSWLEDPRDPEALAFLESQNTYAAGHTAGQRPLADAIYTEIVTRAQGTDRSVPSRKGDWWYYTRTVDGAQHEIHCRSAAARPDDRAAGPAADPAGEQVLLDENEPAAGHDHFALGAFAVSPDGRRLAYSTDHTGGERFTVQVKDLERGEALEDEISGVFYGLAWSKDGSALYYVTVDDAWRPCRVWRHTLGTKPAQDELLYEETDERFSVRISATRSERFIVATSSSRLTSEVRLIDAARPDRAPLLVAARRPGVAYRVDHHRDRLLILHNSGGATDFELAEARLDAPADWRPLIPYRPGTRLLSVDAFEEFLVVSFRSRGLIGLRVIGADGSDHELEFAEPLHCVSPGTNLDYQATNYQFTYESHATPKSVYDYDVRSRELTLRWRRAVLPLQPDGPPFDPADYVQRREWAVSPDGTRVPISIVHKRGLVPRDGSAGFLMFGYGAYETAIDPLFSIPLLSLLDRGLGFAIAHVRGGGELGRGWYEAGRLEHKGNSFADFLACARHLVAERWTSADRLIARCASAGGLLVGAAVNEDPGAFAGVVAQVPFVDVLTTMLDPSRPLTAMEWEEWGDPLHDPEAYHRIKGYSPYQNIAEGGRYPPVLALGALHDVRVPVTEAAKWIARFQAVAEGGPFLLRTATASGHAGRSGRYDAWRTEAEILAWAITAAGAWRGPSASPAL